MLLTFNLLPSGATCVSPLSFMSKKFLCVFPLLLAVLKTFQVLCPSMDTENSESELSQYQPFRHLKVINTKPQTKQFHSFFIIHIFQHLNHSCCSGLPPNCQTLPYRAELSTRHSSLAGASTLSGSVSNSPRGPRWMMVYQKSLSAMYLVCSSVTGFGYRIQALWNLFLCRCSGCSTAVPCRDSPGWH